MKFNVEKLVQNVPNLIQYSDMHEWSYVAVFAFVFFL